MKNYIETMMQMMQIESNTRYLMQNVILKQENNLPIVFRKNNSEDRIINYHQNALLMHLFFLNSFSVKFTRGIFFRESTHTQVTFVFGKRIHLCRQPLHAMCYSLQ